MYKDKRFRVLAASALIIPYRWSLKLKSEARICAAEVGLYRRRNVLGYYVFRKNV